jgi:hypothetical protein
MLLAAGGVVAAVSVLATALIALKVVSPADLTEFISSQPESETPTGIASLEVESSVKVGAIVGLVAALGCVAGGALALVSKLQRPTDEPR